jgi:hypothetical protein
VSDEEHVYPFPWRLMGLVALIVVAATIVGGIVLARNSVEDDPVVSTSASASAVPGEPVEEHRQVTILLQVRDKDRKSVSNVLFGVGGETGFVSQLILPRNLLLPTSPPTQLQDVDGPTGPISAQGQIQTLLGVRVDAALEMDRLAWAGLLDSIGSVPGTQHAANPGSFPLVLNQVLAQLPKDEGAVGTLLTSLGSMARTTVTNEDASHVLALLGDGLRTQDVQREVLPVTVLRAGSAQVDITRQPDADETILRMFPLALLQPGHSGATRVLIERAGASLGASTIARLNLDGAGYGVVDRPSTDVRQKGSTVFVAGDSDQALAHGKDVANILGLPATSIVPDMATDATVDVRVVLGSNFRPV